MKQIQEWLGYSDFLTTANVYAHLDYNSKYAIKFYFNESEVRLKEGLIGQQDHCCSMSLSNVHEKTGWEKVLRCNPKKTLELCPSVGGRDINL